MSTTLWNKAKAKLFTAINIAHEKHEDGRIDEDVLVMTLTVAHKEYSKDRLRIASIAKLKNEILKGEK